MNFRFSTIKIVFETSTPPPTLEGGNLTNGARFTASKPLRPLYFLSPSTAGTEPVVIVGTELSTAHRPAPQPGQAWRRDGWPIILTWEGSGWDRAFDLRHNLCVHDVRPRVDVISNGLYVGGCAAVQKVRTNEKKPFLRSVGATIGQKCIVIYGV